MAQLVFEDGEVVQFRVRVRNAHDTHAICELVATDRRLVLTTIGTSKPGASALFGVLGGVVIDLFGRLLSGSHKPQVTHVIRRAVFRGVEVTGKRAVLVESTGEGYARQWFEVSTEHPQQLADLIHRWEAGQPLDAFELPTAIIIKK